MERSGIRESPGFRPDGLHPGYIVFVQPKSLRFPPQRPPQSAGAKATPSPI